MNRTVQEAMRIVSFWSEQKLRSEIHTDLQDGDYEGAYEMFVRECRAVFSPLGTWKPGDASRKALQPEPEAGEDAEAIIEEIESCLYGGPHDRVLGLLARLKTAKHKVVE